MTSLFLLLAATVAADPLPANAEVVLIEIEGGGHTWP